MKKRHEINQRQRANDPEGDTEEQSGTREDGTRKTGRIMQRRTIT
jgi:hypothetical protein